MGEQEKYKNMLRKVIDDTENQKIQSSEELINMLITELTKGKGLKGNIQTLAK